MNAEVTVYNIQCLSGSSSVLLDCQFVWLEGGTGGVGIDDPDGLGEEVIYLMRARQ